MKRDKKEQIAQEIAGKIERAQGIYFTEFQGLNVTKMAQLRNEFRKSGIEYKVVKNTLIRKALKSVADADKLASGLKNTTAVAFGYDDPVAPAKIIRKFSKDNESLKFKMATIDGVVFGADALPQLSEMLSKTENLGRAAGLINNVISSVPMVMNAVMRNLVSVIDQVGKLEK
ncbi:MAG: 50S ribosomal protein L10 [Chlorobiaceae bacterium]|nr:50S ribosomal protein L10 [Chlorobiaceae bacterium]NTW73785.1 50S ribosomal protein L10 [Chlorobiaceae bacterium]